MFVSVCRFYSRIRKSIYVCVFNIFLININFIDLSKEFFFVMNQFEFNVKVIDIEILYIIVSLN